MWCIDLCSSLKMIRFTLTVFESLDLFFIKYKVITYKRPSLFYKNTKFLIPFLYLGVELRVQHWAGQQATLQHTENLGVQLSEERSVGHQADTRSDLLFFLLLWRLLQDKRNPVFLKLSYIYYETDVGSKSLPADFCSLQFPPRAESCSLMNSYQRPSSSSPCHLKNITCITFLLYLVLLMCSKISLTRHGYLSLPYSSEH